MLLLTLTLLGCSGDGDSKPADTSTPVDTAAHTGDTVVADSSPDSAPDSADPCADAPTVTYANFGRAFVTGSCQGCHASTAADRYDAPETVTFDTVDECWTWSARILARAAAADPTMPPQGGVTDDDRQLLTWWLTCSEEGT